MKIVHVITTIEMGGAETQLLMLSREQKKLGNDVLIIPLKGKNELMQDFLEQEIDLNLSLLNHNILTQVLKFRKIIKNLDKKKELVIHAHLPQAEILCSLSLNCKIPFVITRHYGGDFFPRGPKKLSQILSKVCSFRANRVIAISKSVESLLIRNKELFSNKKIRVIHYGFDKSRFRTEKLTDKLKSRKSGQLIIGTIARLSPEKDISTLLKAIQIIKREHKSVFLKIVGVGPLESKLKKESKSLGISESVEWLGKQRKLLSFLRNLDLFVLTSKFEGFGMVLLEAMYAGVPIVCAKNSAIYEVVGDDGAGIYFRTEDENDLSSKIGYVFDANKKKIRNAQNERLKLFSIKNTTALHMKLYLELLN